VNITKTFYAKNRKQWRAWLAKNHAKAKEIWLIYYKKDSSKPRIPYDEAVEEALCYGWIDSTVKTVDNESFAQRFTPRRHGSEWSELNKERVRMLLAQGKMTAAGMAHAHMHTKTKKFTVAPDIRKALQDADAWKQYQKFPERYRRIRIAWIEAARYRQPIFAQRLRYFVKMTAQNKRYGTMQ
jgi:uncharacterized protein YdeI (YjbR/CyaY-like superfamily)